METIAEWNILNYSIYKKKRYQPKVVFIEKCNINFTHPSLLVLSEDIIWHNTFLGWEIEEWEENSFSTILYALTSMILDNTIQINFYDEVLTLLNRKYTKVSRRYYLTLVKDISSTDLLVKSIYNQIEKEEKRKNKSKLLRRLLINVLNEFSTTYEDQRPGRCFMKGLIKESSLLFDWLNIKYNPKSFRIADNFVVEIDDIHRKDIGKEYNLINKKINYLRSVNMLFDEFYTLLKNELSQEFKNRLPDTS